MIQFKSWKFQFSSHIEANRIFYLILSNSTPFDAFLTGLEALRVLVRAKVTQDRVIVTMAPHSTMTVTATSRSIMTPTTTTTPHSAMAITMTPHVV